MFGARNVKVLLGGVVVFTNSLCLLIMMGYILIMDREFCLVEIFAGYMSQGKGTGIC